MPAIHKKKDNKKLEALTKICLIMVLDVLSVAVCYFFGLWLRFDFKFQDIYPVFLEGYANNIALWCAVHLIVFAIFRLYSSIWVFVSTSEVFRILGAYVVLAVIGVFGLHFYGVALPRSSCVVGLVFSAVCTVMIRFSYRMIRTAQQKIAHMTHASGVM